jgi:hypothetical protein
MGAVQELVEHHHRMKAKEFQRGRSGERRREGVASLYRLSVPYVYELWIALYCLPRQGVSGCSHLTPRDLPRSTKDP